MKGLLIEDAKACAEARREKNDASCTAAYDRYKTMRGNEKQEAETKEAVNKEKMVREALIEAQKEIISTCLNFDVEKRGTCMNEAQEEFVEYAKILHPPLEQMEDKLKLQIQRNAVHSIIYDFVKNCMENSESNDEKDAKTMAEKGGMSGLPLVDKSTEFIRLIYQMTNGNLPIVGVGGIMNAEHAWQKITAGATLLQAYSAFVFEGPSISKNIVKGLNKKLREHNLTSIEQAIGLDHKGDD